MQEAYFENIRTEIIACLEKAKYSVSVAMAWFTSLELFHELLQCLNRGVKVRLVLLDDPINFMEYAPDFNEFIKEGGELYIATSDIGFMHHKFCIIDNSVAVTGSYNWTYYAEMRNMENIIISNDVHVVTRFAEEFEHLCSTINSVDDAPRLSCEQIEMMEQVNFNEINYEVEKICKNQSKPIVKLFETKTQVFISEVIKKPFAAYNVGVLARDSKGNDVFDVIISKNVSLPYESNERLLYYNSNAQKPLFIHFVYGANSSCGSVIFLCEEDFGDIVCGIHSDNLTLRSKMNLDVNGDLRIEVECVETGIRKTVTKLRKQFVKYE